MVFTRKPDVRYQPTHDASGPLPTSPSQLYQRPGESRSGDAAGPSVIGNDLSIEGQSITIRCQGELLINGNIQADLHSKKLVVGQDATINGAIAANDVDVHGHVQGAIYGAHVVLRTSARVDGDIHSEQLQIERGATFDGRSRKVTDLAEIAPKLESQRGAAAGVTGAVPPAPVRLHG